MIEVLSPSDTVEQMHEKLEILYFAGCTGVGGLLEDPKLEGPLIKLIAGRARLGNKAEGRFTTNVQGRKREILVAEYDSFGEACFRLRLGKAQQNRQAVLPVARKAAKGWLAE